MAEIRHHAIISIHTTVTGHVFRSTFWGQNAGHSMPSFPIGPIQKVVTVTLNNFNLIFMMKSPFEGTQKSGSWHPFQFCPPGHCISYKGLHCVGQCAGNSVPSLLSFSGPHFIGQWAGHSTPCLTSGPFDELMKMQCNALILNITLSWDTEVWHGTMIGVNKSDNCAWLRNKCWSKSSPRKMRTLRII